MSQFTPKGYGCIGVIWTLSAGRSSGADKGNLPLSAPLASGQSSLGGPCRLRITLNAPAASAPVRALLALLAVWAALLFPLRQDALGGLLGASVPMAGMQTGMDMSDTDLADTDMAEMEGMTHAHHAPQPAPAAPSPKPAAHDHTAHCPFCVTNAFALEAGIVGLPQGPPAYLPLPLPLLIAVTLRAVAAADARAPPLFPS